MKKFSIIIAIVALLTSVGCAQRTIVQDTATKKVSTETEGMDEVQPISDEISSTDIARSDSERLTQIASQYKTSSEGVPEFGDIFFDYDRYNIGSEYRSILDDLSIWLINNNAILLVEGHCDERGTREYNLALGDRRSLSIKDYLLASGVPDLKIESVSYGEERPTCRQQKESCWSQNRRGHFIIEVVK